MKQRRAHQERRASKRQTVSQWYREAWYYLRGSARHIAAVIALFTASVLVGFFFPSLFLSFDELLRSILEESEELSGVALMVYIFLNNLQSSLSGMLFGLMLGIFPVGAALLNGTLLGYVLRLSFGVSGFAEFWRVLPHGVFELPAVFIALGMGLRFGGWVFAKHKLEALSHHLYFGLLVFVLIVLPLLVIAAVIEGLLITMGA